MPQKAMTFFLRDRYHITENFVKVEKILVGTKPKEKGQKISETWNI